MYYNPNKPEKWHFKVFSLNDATAGYICDFYLYEGKAEQGDADISATTQPVLKLFCLNPIFFERYHILVTDNWYTQIDNLNYVIDTRNHYLGTIRTSKRGLSAEGKFAKTGRAKKSRGEFKQMEQLRPDGQKNYFTSWQDNKPEHLLSSFPSYKSACNRVVRNADGSWDPLRSIPQPTAIKVYNAGMGGTDAFDQIMSYYRPKIKSTKSWYPKVFDHMINASIVNSFIICRLYYKKPNSFVYLDYLRELITELSEEKICQEKTIDSYRFATRTGYKKNRKLG